MIFRRKRKVAPSGAMPNLPSPSTKGRRLGQAALFDRLVERIHALPGPRHVVDLGCGSGVLSLRLAQTCPEIRITGLEASTDLVRLATKAAAEAGLATRIRFDRSDLRTLPISDHSVDLLVGAGILAEATSPQGLLAEINRVLVPGGFALLLESIEAVADADDQSTAAAYAEAETHFRRLIDPTPLRAHTTFSRAEAEGEHPFLEISLAPPMPESRGYRR